MKTLVTVLLNDGAKFQSETLWRTALNRGQRGNFTTQMERPVKGVWQSDWQSPTTRVEEISMTSLSERPPLYLFLGTFSAA